MDGFKVFSWDTSPTYGDEETELKDPAYAGDKEPDSSDDIPCGEHFIPSDKDCHDGEAHDPEPGENPYWTDENSAEKRNERGVDWDDNKPEEPAPELPETRRIPDEAVESVPDGQWARQKDMVAQAMEGLQAVLVRTPKGNTKANGLREAAQNLNSDDRADALEAVEYLQNAVNEARTFVGGPELSDGVEEWTKRMDKAQFAVDVFNSSVEVDDPRDIQVWDKIRNRPETLEVEDLLQMSGVEADDPAAQRKIGEMQELLSSWRESPTLGGADLAKMFMDDPDAPMSRANMLRLQQGRQPEPVEPSPFKTNTKLAMAILDRSARADDAASNKMLWESFGLSEEWTPTSYLHDHRKAGEKATREMKEWADWSKVDQAQQDYMMSGADMAEAEDVKEAFEEEYQRRKDEILAERDGPGGIDKDRFQKLVSDLEDDADKVNQGVTDAHMGMFVASENVLKEAAKLRDPIKNAMRLANQYTKIDGEAAGEILHKAGNPLWSEIDEDDEDYKAAKGKGTAGLSGKKLLALRWKHRDQTKLTWDESSRYPNSAKIQESLQDLFSIAHRDTVGGPGMTNIQWESEVMVRAYASASDGGSICLSVGADPKKMTKHEMYDKARKYSKDSAMDGDDIAIHEFAHHMEFTNTDMRQRFADFYRRRTEGQPIVKNGDIDPRTGEKYPDMSHYDDDERFIPDHFFSTYCGKTYGETAEHGELVSMGVQALYNEHMWNNMVRDDPEHLALIIATLRGY